MFKYFSLLILIVSLSSFSMTPEKFTELRLKFKNNSLNDDDCTSMNSVLSDNNLNTTARFYINSMLSNFCFFQKQNYFMAYLYATNAYNCSNSVCEISKRNILNWLNFTAQKCPCFQSNDPMGEGAVDDLEIIMKNNELNF